MKRDGATGFTLIELMIVVVVIAILAAVAYPSYQDHVRKAKRAEGKTSLLKTAQVLERWYSDRSTYGTSPAPPWVPPAVPTAIDVAPLYGQVLTTPIYSGENALDNRSSYRITAAAETAGCPLAACFLVMARPNAPYVDPVCGIFTITSTGTRCWSTADPPDPAVVMTCLPTPANASTCKW